MFYMFNIIETPRNYFTRELLHNSNVAFHCSVSNWCTPRIHPLMEWTIPAFAFPAEAGPHLPTPEG